MAAQDETVDLFAHALWPQGDARDPLGVWASRHVMTGSAGGGSIKVQVQPGAERAGAYIYTCYTAIVAFTTQEGANIKLRLLTNWPNADDDAGIQGVATLRIVNTDEAVGFTAPEGGPGAAMMSAQDRFILLFDPRPAAGAFTIVETEISGSTDGFVYVFESWGYYWDRGVLNAPGGPRHPGSS